MVSRANIGQTFERTTHQVEKGRLNFFAKATSECNAIFKDEEVAKSAGYPALPAPPTFSLCLEMDRADPFDFLQQLDIDISRILHAEQSFVYHAPIFAGDVLTYTSKVSDLYDKKRGALTFIAIEREAKKADGTLAVTLTSTLVVRNG